MSSEFTLLEWNLNRASTTRFRRQAEALANREADVLALVEVGIKAGPKARDILGEYGFEHVVFSQDLVEDEEQTSSGLVLASRYPFSTSVCDGLEVPAPDRSLSAVFDTPFGELEGHAVHVLPGSSYGWTKVEFFEAIYERLSGERQRPRFLCGDFNSPRAEHRDGTVEVFGDNRGERWKKAERSVICGLAEHGLPDAYREVHGYEKKAWSHQLIRKGELKWQRRFDHVFASPELNPSKARYLHELDEHSDHTPLEVVFEPDLGTMDSHQELLRGLSYDRDARSTEPDQSGHRLGRFKAGWRKAVRGQEYTEETLKQLTWENLGWRLGRLFGETAPNRIEALYEWCVEQQDSS